MFPFWRWNKKICQGLVSWILVIYTNVVKQIQSIRFIVLISLRWGVSTNLVGHLSCMVGRDGQTKCLLFLQFSLTQNKVLWIIFRPFHTKHHFEWHMLYSVQMRLKCTVTFYCKVGHHSLNYLIQSYNKA